MGRTPIIIFASIVLAVLLLPVFALLGLSSSTEMKLTTPVTVVGAATPVRVQITNPHGVRHVKAVLEQNGQEMPIFEQTKPSTRLLFLRKHEAPTDVSFDVGKQKAPNLKDGKATLRISATGNDFRGSTAEMTLPVDVNTQPLMVSADGFQHYVNQGGSELVVFNVSGYWTEAGVRVGKYTFRSFPMPGQPDQIGAKGQRFSLFAYPWDLPANVIPVVYARNPSGAEATARFWFRLFPKKFRSRDLTIDDKFLERVDNQIEPNGQGDLLQRFLHINRELRKQNNATLANLKNQTEEKILWHGPFERLGAVEAQFADDRSYVYHGKKVDEQMHLGFDLANTLHVPVTASNDGKVIYAAPLGIYGNCIVVDHGYGLQSIYGHLSQIEVKQGDMVKKGQEMGRSGSTGLAGGDHLHFSLQVDGVQVNPVEWWDPHWIHDRVLSKIHE